MTPIKRTAISLLILAALLAWPGLAPAQSPQELSPEVQQYFDRITDIISRNLEEIIPKDQWPDESTRILVLAQINSDGTIARSEIVTQSEHEYMKQALQKALEKAQPLPAPPEEFQIESGLRLVGLSFNFDKKQPAKEPGQAEPGKAE